MLISCWWTFGQIKCERRSGGQHEWPNPLSKTLCFSTKIDEELYRILFEETQAEVKLQLRISAPAPFFAKKCPLHQVSQQPAQELAHQRAWSCSNKLVGQLVASWTDNSSNVATKRVKEHNKQSSCHPCPCHAHRVWGAQLDHQANHEGRHHRNFSYICGWKRTRLHYNFFKSLCAVQLWRWQHIIGPRGHCYNRAG